MNRRFQNNEKIGDSRVLGFIGQGGMGEVYHFYHEKLNRSVAVKVLGGNGGLDENYKIRFLNEAQLQARLQHQNIATLYDFQEVGKELLIFMELVDGECLEALIERRFFSIEESLKVFESIVEAIVYVHSNGIIHRDIKAENVKVNSSGVPKLLDFGIAKDPKSQNLTQIGGVIGTPNYLAPELLDGHQASAQTDIWALGVLLYKMLTGVAPFESEVFENLIYQITLARIKSVETVNTAIPKAVSNIVNKCLAKDLNQRYQTADELLQDVRKVLNERYSNYKFLGSDSQKKSLNSSLPITYIAAIGGSAFLVLILIVIGIWAVSGPDQVVKGNENGVRKPIQENQNINNLIVKKEESPKSTPENKPETSLIKSTEGKNTKTVRIDAIGGSAEVWRNGQKIGNTPMDLEVSEKEIVNLKLKRNDSHDSDVQVEATVGKKIYTFSLRSK